MHAWSYDVITTNQNARAVIVEALDHLEERELTRISLQGQKPLTPRDRGVIESINAAVLEAANADGNVTADIRLLHNDLETPPVEVKPETDSP